MISQMSAQRLEEYDAARLTINVGTTEVQHVKR